LSHEDAQNRLKAALRQHQIDNIVLFGGNGTLRYIPPLLERWRIPSVGIPTTIDNDVPGTELTLGFDSACNFAYHAIDGILATAHALAGRIFMVETLGGNTGYLALAIATGAAAHAVLVPEYPYTEDWLAERVVNAVNMHGYALIVLSEGTPGARTLVDTLPQRTQIRMRDVRLGHAQRGGIPSHRDRVLAAESARAAHDALHAGLSFGVTVVRSGQVVVHEGLLPETKSAPDLAQYKAINGL
jgi:6-phosphofructokinase 1